MDKFLNNLHIAISILLLAKEIIDLIVKKLRARNTPGSYKRDSTIFGELTIIFFSLGYIVVYSCLAYFGRSSFYTGLTVFYTAVIFVAMLFVIKKFKRSVKE